MKCYVNYNVHREIITAAYVKHHALDFHVENEINIHVEN